MSEGCNPNHDPTGIEGGVDTNARPWTVNPDLPEIALKRLRISDETGIASLIVRHNVAAPHNHLGAGDFMVLSGRNSYRAGPSAGYGPGVWFYEPARARHQATPRLPDEDLIYTANLYGPAAFNSGKGTPLTNVLSRMDCSGKSQEQCVVPCQENNWHNLGSDAWRPL